MTTSSHAPQAARPDEQEPEGVPGGSYNVDEEFVEEHSDEPAQDSSRPS